MTSQYLPFGTGTGANVMGYSSYNALAARSFGFSTGTAASVQLNTVWRQASVAAAALAQFASVKAVQDLLDDGDVSHFAAVLEAAIAKMVSDGGVLKTGDIFFKTGMAGMTRPTPAGAVYANGANVSRSGATNALWLYYGSPNTGDGSTTFTLPDFRGVFLRGLDDGRGLDTGRVIGSQQADAVGPHVHQNNWPMWDEGGQTNNHMASGGPGSESVTFQLPTGNVTGAVETRPVNIAVWPFIKL